jgi:N-acylneuraminate cytidylyltransferase
MPLETNISAVALVPARCGSTRVPHKNIVRLAGHPAMAYTIAAARASGVFSDVVLCTDDPLYAEIGEYYGASVPLLRPQAISTAISPDIEWVVFMLDGLSARARKYELFSILRPTNPFRRAATIRTAFDTILGKPGADSLRAVSPVSEHPGKMWVLRGDFMVPLMPLTPADAPWHSQQMSALPKVYKQNASLEIAWTRVARADPPTIAGHAVIPFISQGMDGFDINLPEDLIEAEALIASGRVELPPIEARPFPKALPTDRVGA